MPPIIVSYIYNFGGDFFVKKLYCFLCILLLLVNSCFPAFASLATPSNYDLKDYLEKYEKIPLPVDNPGLGHVPDFPVHTSSNADNWLGDDGNPVVDSDRLLVDNTLVPYSSASNNGIIIGYARASDGNLYPVSRKRGETFTFPVLSGGVYYEQVEFVFRKGNSLPEPGTYKVKMYLYDRLGTVRNKGIDNVKADYFRLEDYSSAGGVTGLYNSDPTVVNRRDRSWQIETTVNVNYNSRSIKYCMDFYTDKPITELSISLNDATFWFSDVKEPALSGGSNGNGENQIVNSNNQIAQNTATMNDTLKEIVQTISKQLEALWNQQYNYIHLEDMANADKNADKIVGSIGDQMQNDDRNTDTITNGYNSSSMDKDTNRLSGSVNELNQAETQVLDKVNNELSKFQFDTSYKSYITSITIMSNFLQDLYTHSGAFKVVINVGFLLSIASIVIGLYRFKEG